MPLNKLENFIKNTEGRILYVNPNDLDSTDSITNQGNSLAQPFKTIQRALLEAARFSYLRGYNNDLVEKTTILVFPGEHLIDNRPGYAIYENGLLGAYAVPPTGGSGVPAPQTLSLELDSVFDLTDTDNILHKFNSVYGGVIIPRGTSIVGLDLRKTKIRPKYVPNPTDPNVSNSAIFRITGACYFWQLSFFDGDESGVVYTNPTYFDENYQSTPGFSHHKLTCFEYADGVNKVDAYPLTDLDMYYSKLSNAYNTYRNIDAKFPAEPLGFSKKASEWEIVGAFASDPITISSIFSGNGSTAGSRVTVTTASEHNLNSGTPIKIRGVAEGTYNISTKVQEVLNSTQFTYLLSTFPINLDARPSSSGATVTVETDTVSGASPYIFNCSLRSVWGMNGMHADGRKASGFRSMVVAQFTAVSLQKDDRAFVKYNQSSRSYESVTYTPVYGANLPSGASQTNSNFVYHLDQNAIYRNGWETSHIKISNDSFIQVVSVFAIGFNKHFDVRSGSDASITNSNSNFGQISLSSEGFKKEAFDKDDKGYITSIIPPRYIDEYDEDVIEWLSLDVGLTTSYGNSTTDTSRLYLYGFTSVDSLPTSLTQGYRVGARANDVLYFSFNGVEYTAPIFMEDPSNIGQISAVKSYDVLDSPSNNVFTLDTALNLLTTGEKVIINSDDGDLPENITEHLVYYVIKLNSTQIKLASSYTNAILNVPITVYGGTNLTIQSRVSDKNAGELGSPIQFDTTNSNWYIKVKPGNSIYTALNTLGVDGLSETTDLSYIKRVLDGRTLDEKLYKVRVVIPKELPNSKNPETGFILQESSSTGVRAESDFTRNTISNNDYDFNRNLRLIDSCSISGNSITVNTEKPHNLQVGDIVIIKYITCTNNLDADPISGYNGSFAVTVVPDRMSFRYSIIDIYGATHTPGTFTNDITVRTQFSPRYERNDLKSNIYIYRNEVISPYIEDVQDGIYHLYLLNANNRVSTEFTSFDYSQSPVDLYPQLDRDNFNSNPESAKTFAKRFPIGDVVTNDLKKSITRETVDKLLADFSKGLEIASVTTPSATTSTITFDKDHLLGGVFGFTNLVGGSGHTQGTHYNVKLYSDVSLSIWKGAAAKVTVSAGGVVQNVQITAHGSAYSNGETLYLDPTKIGGIANSTISLTTAGISTSIGDVVQIAGSNTRTSDQYYRITSIPSRSQISIAKTSGDPAIGSDQYVFVIGPSVKISSTSYNSSSGLLTVNTTTPHGLLVGNKFRIIDSSNNNKGDYVVEEKTSLTSFTVFSYKSISATNGYVLKHGLSSNVGVSDKREENLGVRGVPLYANESLFLQSTITTDTVITVAPSAGISTVSARFPLGSYIQIDNEIMRITTSGSDTTFGVIRGSLGTRQGEHEVGSLIRKIEPIAVEFRRPSILRASGHTFEYMGFGPGNYSTGLPQVQIRSLTEREEFLAQSQEKSCGAVIYSGMNNKGDIFTGNTKTQAASGEVISYDIPKPTVTGQDPSKLSVVFDEVTVKERLLVEGGTSATVLSQFNGPLTLNGQVRIKAKATFSKQVKISNTTESTNKYTGALLVSGGVGILGNLNVGGIGVFSNETDSTTITNGSLVTNGGLGVEKRLNVGGRVGFTSTSDSTTGTNGALVVTGGVGIGKSLSVDGYIRARNAEDSSTPYNGGLRVSGGAGISKKLNVGGIVGVTSTLTSSSPTTGALVVTGGIGVGKDVYIGESLNVAANKSTTLGGTLSVVGNTNLSGSLGVAAGRATDLGGTLNVDQATTLQSTLAVTGATTLSSTLGVSGATTLNSTLRVVSGTTLQSTLAVTGATTLSSTLSVNSNTTIGGILSVSGATTLSSTLSVSGATTLSSTLSVSSSTTIGGTLSVSSSTTIGGPLTVSGTTQINGSLNVTGDITAFFSSDQRLKDNITPISNALEKVNSISGNTYDWNEESGKQGHDVGVIAQEVLEVLPEAVITRDNGYLAVDYHKVIPLLVESIKSLSKKVEILEQKLSDK